MAPLTRSQARKPPPATGKPYPAGRAAGSKHKRKQPPPPPEELSLAAQKLQSVQREFQTTRALIRAQELLLLQRLEAPSRAAARRASRADDGGGHGSGSGSGSGNDTDTDDSRRRLCYYLLVNMVHANLCTRTVWPQFQLQYWRGAPVRSRCCLQRVLGGQPAVVVLARGARMHWVLHYSCFKQIININSPLFAGRLGVKANEPTLKALVEQDYGVSFGPSRRHEHLHTRQGSCAGAVPESELHGFSAQHDMTLS